LPSPIGHSFGAYAPIVLLQPDLLQNRERHSIALGMAFFFGSLPDADFIVAHFTRIPYLQHHYFSHSIAFSLLIALAIYGTAVILRTANKFQVTLMLWLAYLSHLIMDYFTEDGSYPYGIPLLWPLTSRHFVAPVQIFLSIHRGEWQDIASLHNLAAIAIEIAVMLPLALVARYVAGKRNVISPRKV